MPLFSPKNRKAAFAAHTTRVHTLPSAANVDPPNSSLRAQPEALTIATHSAPVCSAGEGLTASYEMAAQSAAACCLGLMRQLWS